MKICAIIASLFIILSCASVSAKSSPVDIEGTWKGEIKSGMGGPPMQVTFNFKNEGDSIKGTVNGKPDQWIPLENIEHNGKKISFEVTSDMNGMKSVTKYKGKIKGDKIKMTFKRETPGSSRGKSKPMSTGMSGANNNVGLMPQIPLNAFTLERVSNEPVNPVN